MDIEAKCSECGEDVDVSQGEKYTTISTCRECNADVKLRWFSPDGVEHEGVLKI